MAVGRKRHRDDINNYKIKRPKVLNQPLSLLDVAAKSAASSYPYEEIEETLGYVPTPVLNRIMYHSFPQNENCIRLYSSNNLHLNATEIQKQPFNTGVKLLEHKAVTDVIQVGFHVSGVVHEKVGICNRQKTYNFKCSMNIDRNCITSTECTCNTKGLLWCPHIVAVALYRIRNPESVSIKPPISDSVSSLKLPELQKLLLTLVSDHSNTILPSVQDLLDALRQPESEINLLNGLPDPTAGGSCEDENTWHIDDENIRKQIISDLFEERSGKNVICLMNKVREMISAKDRNYINLLRTVTDTIMDESIKRPEVQEYHRTRKIYDELQSIWFCVMLNPNLKSNIKKKLVIYLDTWTNKPNCPKENIDDSSSTGLLQDIIESFQKDSLQKNGSLIEAYTLSSQHEKALKAAKELLRNLKDYELSFNDASTFCKSTEPIYTAYTILSENEYEAEALEIALLSLSRSFYLPKGEYSQNRLTHRYERLISQLEQLDYSNSILQDILIKYSYALYNNMSTIFDHDILPNHCLTRFLFERLITIDHELAFKIALLMLPLNLNVSVNDDDDDFLADTRTYNGTICHTVSHLEFQQGELAACILKQCDKHPDYLKLTLTAILEDIRQPSQLLKLAKLCQSIAVAERQNLNIDILNAAFELGVRSIRLIVDAQERKSCIRWLVSCAVDTGRQAVDFLIRNWTDLFEPREISNEIAPMLTSQPVFFHLKLDSLTKREELLSTIRNMVIESCIKDPVPCVLFALTLCEEHQEDFELVCQITSESSDRFNTAQLFSVARYLESKKHLQRAFKIGVQALKKLDIGVLDCQHPAICDVLWVSTLASNLGIDELTDIVPVIENCIHNPLLLTEIAQRCTNKVCTRNSSDSFSCQKEPLNRLVASAQKLFIRDVELKLRTITRKNYNDFTKYLQKIRRSFLLAEDGLEQFHWLLDYIMTSQRGKKKLHEIISQTFINSTVNDETVC